jgi:hypothetical protein
MKQLEKKQFCTLIAKAARQICREANLCQITKEGCRRYKFTNNPSLCCKFCKHLIIGKGCRTDSVLCALGMCHVDWIGTNYISPDAIKFFGKENENTLKKLQLLKKAVSIIVDIPLYSRLSVKENFSKNARKYSDVSDNKFFRGFNKNPYKL